MNALVQISQCGMNRTVPRHPAQACQSIRPDQHREMALARAIIAAMACVFVAFIDHLQPRW